MSGSKSSAPSAAKATPLTPAVTRPKRPAMSAADKKQLEAAPVVEPFTAASLPPAERATATTAAAAAHALLLKGLLHRLDPAAYPVPAAADAPEAVAAKAAAALPAGTFARLTPRLKQVAGDRARLDKALGTLAGTDLRKAQLNLAAFKAHALRPVTVPVGAQVDGASREVEPAEAGAAASADGDGARALYRRMDFVLRAVHCVDETNPETGDDDIVLGGALVGAGGNVAAIQSRFIGEFDDGDYANLGELPLGQFSLRSTAGYPKTMYVILQLVESDGDDRETAQALTNAIRTVATLVVGALASPTVGAIAGAIVSGIGSLLGLFFDDDYFPPYGVRVTLNSENQFGGVASGQLRTGNINGHGGTYRIGFRWVMGA